MIGRAAARSPPEAATLLPIWRKSRAHCEHSKRYLLRISATPLFPAIFDTVTHCAANDETIFEPKSQQIILNLVARRANKSTNAPVQLISFRIEN